MSEGLKEDGLELHDVPQAELIAASHADRPPRRWPLAWFLHCSYPSMPLEIHLEEVARSDDEKRHNQKESKKKVRRTKP